MKNQEKSICFLLPEVKGGTYFVQSEVSSVSIDKDRIKIRLKNSDILLFAPDVKDSRLIVEEIIKKSLMVLGFVISSGRVSDIVKTYGDVTERPYCLQEIFDIVILGFSDEVV